MSEYVTPVFLLGTQRSGTTLLTRILTNHPNLYFQNELQMDGLWEGELTTEIFLKRVTDRIRSVHGVELAITPQDDFIWGWKDPLLTFHMDRLAQLFPLAKYVLIIRDGRGVANSYMDNRWGLGTTAYTGALRWQDEVSKQMAFAKKMGDRCLTVRYEDIIADMPGRLAMLCDFMGVPYREEMLDYHSERLEFALNRENRNTTRPPDISLTQKWRTSLSSREIDLIEYVAAETLTRNQYELVGKPIKPSRLELAYYKLHQAIIGELQLLYKWKYRDIFKKWGLVK